jgi:hypothetical protein
MSCLPKGSRISPGLSLALYFVGPAVRLQRELLASALFGDVPRAALGWIPVAITSVAGSSPYWLRGGDRAEGLERAFESNWKRAVETTFPAEGQRPILLDAPFLSLFSSATTAAP